LRCLAQTLPPIPAWVGSVRSSGAPQGKPVADVAALLEDGKLKLTYTKALLPFYDVFDESRYFEPGNSPATHLVGNQCVGMTVCEDIWNDKNFWKKRFYTRDPVEETVRAGASVLINIAASPYARGKIELRREMLRAIARERRIPVVYVNLVGGNDSLIFDGSSCALNAEAEVCAQARSFEEDLVVLDTTGGVSTTHAQPSSEIEEVFQALVLGVRDYMRKCGFEKAIVGLSGGIDSSVVAAIAVAALGRDKVWGISMPGPFTSEASITDAQQLAANLGICFRVIPISSIYKQYLAALDPAFDGMACDVTEENIQARVRGNILMALSNKYGALVLSTGNKSELAVGYCTLYGDMAGGLAVIGDVPKTMVYELARHINTGAAEGPIPKACLDKPPSAELRPNQADQDTLPPYEILDTILRAFIEESLSAEEISSRYSLDPDAVRETLRLVSRAEYKRQQAAPTLKVTVKAFGMGRRFPIAQRFIP
jgi:NAD+ synthase (glutamine-hydrolysing)